jgi:hypothetical protein
MGLSRHDTGGNRPLTLRHHADDRLLGRLQKHGLRCTERGAGRLIADVMVAYPAGKRNWGATSIYMSVGTVLVGAVGALAVMAIVNVLSGRKPWDFLRRAVTSR